MVRVIGGVMLVLMLALPARAQDDDFPRVEMSLGYANLGFPCCNSLTFESNRHSGFATTQGFNFTRILGVENYFGYYGLGGRNIIGSNVSMIVNMFGAKLSARTERAVPYFVGGVGVGYLTDEFSFGQSSFGTRWGPGVDVKLNENMAWKVDFTRMSFRQRFTLSGGGWTSGWNLATGISFALSY